MQLGMAAGALLSGLVAATPAPVAAGPVIGSLPRADADDRTPRVVDDAAVPEAGVYELRQVGSTMYAGGDFHTVRSADRSTTYDRRGFLAFDADTGAVSSFAPRFGGQVWAMEPSPDGRYLYIGGSFGSVDGVAANRLVKWDLLLNRLDPTFRFTVPVQRVSDLQLVGNRLFVAGSWEGGLVAVDPTTGAASSYFDGTQVHGGNTQWSTRVYRFAVDPASSRMVVIGSFTSVGAQRRSEVAMLALGPTAATVSAWHSTRWDQVCNGSRWYTRDVDWLPDGSAFAVVTSGGDEPTGSTLLCDAASLWRPVDADGQQPVWVNYTGGDTFHSVNATSRAIFVGGHQRWLDNPLGDNVAGPGAVPRLGLGAIDPVTGRALSWNPWKSTEGGLGAYDLYFTSRGLWVGHFEVGLGTGPSGHETHEGLGLLPF